MTVAPRGGHAGGVPAESAAEVEHAQPLHVAEDLDAEPGLG
ncbi:hypothetical protein Q5762_00005 [Streptomyces sp. P9(2023)]|nr:hypothetical protein [Streptomyces sp. P9(2023)]MDT9686762.1 hypothetical protein [Streptomyces sp. P9(2023)]